IWKWTLPRWTYEVTRTVSQERERLEFVPHRNRQGASVAPSRRLPVAFSSQLTRCGNHNAPGDSSELFSDRDGCPDMRSAKNQSAAAKPRRDRGSDAAFSFRPCLGSGRASLAFWPMSHPDT